MVARAPRKKMYRSMQGRMIDIEKLRAANETVQAVGNMNVNARGDVIGAGGKVVTQKETVIKKYYEQPKGMVSDTPRSKPMPAPRQQMTRPEPKITTAAPKATAKKTVTPKAKAKAETTTKKGIDAALDGLE
jgi:cell division protein FtsN|tara:strand:+ start:603 stop:998 length:396 start_codon:yes stop_codon:yes gene_type:complete